MHQEAQSWHAIFGMVAAGMGISVAPASAMEHRVPGVAFRRLKAPATNICACVATHDTRDLVQSFVQAARDHIKTGHRFSRAASAHGRSAPLSEGAKN